MHILLSLLTIFIPYLPVQHCSVCFRTPFSDSEKPGSHCPQFVELFATSIDVMAVHSGTMPGKSHGQRSLVGYSPWGRKELDTTEQLHTH